MAELKLLLRSASDHRIGSANAILGLGRLSESHLFKGAHKFDRQLLDVSFINLSLSASILSDFSISRQSPPPRLSNQLQFRNKIPLLGGTISISIEPRPSSASRPSARGDDGSAHTPKNTGHPPGRSHKDKVLHELEMASKLRRTYGATAPSKRSSDEVERLYLRVKWTPEAAALGFITTPVDWVVQYEIVSPSHKTAPALLDVWLFLRSYHPTWILKGF
jgi:hypothetical protein